MVTYPPGTLHWTTTHLVPSHCALYLYTGAMMTDLTVEQSMRPAWYMEYTLTQSHPAGFSGDTCKASHNDEYTLCLVSAYFASFSALV